eukprot:420265_1
MMVMYYWLVFLIIFKKSQASCGSTECDGIGDHCCGLAACCKELETCCDGECCDIGENCCNEGCCSGNCCSDRCCTGDCGCGLGDECCVVNNAQKNSEMQDGSVNKTVAHNYYDNWWIIIVIVVVIMVLCCGVALCWLKKVKVKAYGHVGKENEAVEEEMELQETQS